MQGWVKNTSDSDEVSSGIKPDAAIPPSEMKGQEAHHSVQSLHAEAQDSPGTPNTFGKRIKWPMATDKKAWHDFNENIREIFEITSKGSVDKRLLTTAKIIVSYAAEWALKSIQERNGRWQRN